MFYFIKFCLVSAYKEDIAKTRNGCQITVKKMALTKVTVQRLCLIYKQISPYFSFLDSQCLPLEQRAGLFAVQGSKSSVSLQDKVWDGLLGKRFWFPRSGFLSCDIDPCMCIIYLPSCRDLGQEEPNLKLKFMLFFCHQSESSRIHVRGGLTCEVKTG